MKIDKKFKMEIFFSREISEKKKKGINGKKELLGMIFIHVISRVFLHPLQTGLVGIVRWLFYKFVIWGGKSFWR